MKSLLNTLPLLAMLAIVSGCKPMPADGVASAQQFADRQAIEDVLYRANLGFEISDPDLFANAYAEEATFELKSLINDEGYGATPITGYKKMLYQGRDDIRTIISDRLARTRNIDASTLSYDPKSLRRFNRNSDSFIEIIDATHARHNSSWIVVMHTNADIHISAVGRYEDELIKKDDQWLISKRVRLE